MKAEDLLLGFDARQMSSEDSPEWDAQRREDFLLRLDVSRPLSTDTIVWPSICAEELRIATALGHQDLWSDLQRLQSCTAASERSTTSPYHLVAITLHLTESDEAERDYWQTQVPHPTPSTRQEGWTFLGYDVSDRWLLSGLSNCGFLPPQDDVPALREQWGKKLNAYHLFDELEHAAAFREFSNRRVVEHSPFFIFGIWLIASNF
jgi:hypothetical protein